MNTGTNSYRASPIKRRRRSKAESVEVDAIRPDILHEMIENTIVAHIDDDTLKATKAAEESEREAAKVWAETLAGEAA